MSDSRFQINPDPPIQGQSLEVTYLGPAADIEYQVDDGSAVTVTPDADGTFTIDSVPLGGEIAFSDNRGHPGFLHRCIVSIDDGGAP